MGKFIKELIGLISTIIVVALILASTIGTIALLLKLPTPINVLFFVFIVYTIIQESTKKK